MNIKHQSLQVVIFLFVFFIYLFFVFYYFYLQVYKGLAKKYHSTLLVLQFYIKKKETKKG